MLQMMLLTTYNINKIYVVFLLYENSPIWVLTSGFRDVRGSLIARLSRENNPEYMTVRVSSVRVSLLIFLNCSGLTGLPSMDDTITENYPDI